MYYRQLSRRDDILKVLSKSLCPTIFGHDDIKRALILQLLGGNEQNLDNGIHLRGDINIMLIGDPSTAKSQLLRTILDIAPLAISTSGRGSSGVGLTAAVTSDPETSERKLEAGAMVLADRGIVCIDEFDKMSEADRVAIHEVMEQQTVTIAKAGIHASLNARCSVLAAANPIYGQYDRNRKPQENIGLPDSLLSRFDLLFIVLDQFDNAFDRRLSEHVIKSHAYRRAGTTIEPEPLVQSSSSLRLEYATANSNSSQQPDSTIVWQRGGTREFVTSPLAPSTSSVNNSEGDILTKDFLRKYIHYAKSRPAPELSEGVIDQISNAYADMRTQANTPGSRGNLPVTARSLETLIRISCAHAKLRLSMSVDEIDVLAALELVNFVMFRNGVSDLNNTVSAVNAVNKENIPDNKRKANASVVNETEEELKRVRENETAQATVSNTITVSELTTMIYSINEQQGSISIDYLRQEIQSSKNIVMSNKELESTMQALIEEGRVSIYGYCYGYSFYLVCVCI